jgi:probable HAF family extracellular repeat protein
LFAEPVSPNIGLVAPIGNGVATEEKAMHRTLFTVVSALSVCAALSTPIRIAAQSQPGTQSQKQGHHQYKLVDVGTLGGPNDAPVSPYFGLFSGVEQPTLSNEGTFAGQAETSTPDPFASLYCFNYPDCLVTHAIQEKKGQMADLGTLPGPADLSSTATWISGNGLIAGYSENGVIDPFINSPSYVAVLWKQGKIGNLGALKGAYESSAFAVNSRGQVVGYSSNDTLDSNSLLGVNTQTRAVLWQNGNIRELGTLGGDDSSALFINEQGQVVGQSYVKDAVALANPEICFGTPLPTETFFWENGRMQPLGGLGGTCTLAFGLNNLGQVIGAASLEGDQNLHAFLWEHQSLKDLGTLGGDHSFASWINDKGEIIGSASDKGNQRLLGVLWEKGQIVKLASLNGDTCVAADSINLTGQIVGGSGLNLSDNYPACTDPVEHAVIWDKGQILDLNNLVAPAAQLVLTEATYINDGGEISGYGYLANGDMHAFVLIPCDANHLEIEGCDYSLVDEAISAQRKPTPASQIQPANPQAGSGTSTSKSPRRKFAHHFHPRTYHPSTG